MANKIVYGLTNLELDSKKIQLEIKPDELTESTTIDLVPMQDHASIINELEALNGVNVTYHALIKINQKEDLWISRQVVEDLCYLLSIAQGTKIQWIYIDRMGKDDRTLSRLLSDRPTKRYSLSTP